MKFIYLFSLVLAFSSCAEKKSSPIPKNPEYDTLNLTEPKAVGFDSVTQKDYEHCIDLTGNDMVLIINGHSDTAKDIAGLQSLLNKRKSQIIKNKLNIITSAQTNYQRIVDVLDQVTIGKIMDYKMLVK